MNRTDRLYAMAEELRRVGPRGTTSARLARLFEVTTRTVKRDVSALQQAGLPVVAQAGAGGGYVLVGATLPPVALTPAQAVALALAVDALPPGSPFGVDARTARDKVLDAMPAADRARAQALSQRVWTRPDAASADAAARVGWSRRAGTQSGASGPSDGGAQGMSGGSSDGGAQGSPASSDGGAQGMSGGSSDGGAQGSPAGPSDGGVRGMPTGSSDGRAPDAPGGSSDGGAQGSPARSSAPRVAAVASPGVLRAVEDALSRERVLAIEYVTVAGDASHRRVEPIVLTRTHGRWYLAAWCRTRDDVRWFRLDRVRRADVTAEPYDARPVAVVGAPPDDARPVGRRADDD